MKSQGITKVITSQWGELYFTCPVLSSYIGFIHVNMNILLSLNVSFHLYFILVSNQTSNVEVMKPKITTSCILVL